MKRTLLFSLTILCLFLFSCKKESSEDGGSTGKELLGTWNLLNLDFEGEASNKIISEDLGSFTNAILMDYVSTNNKGTVTFEENKMISNELAYDLNGTVTFKFFLGDVLTDSYDSTINVSVPPSSSTSDYVRVGADSIYCPNGAFLDVEGADDLESRPTGFKYKFDGNKLIMTVKQKELAVNTEDDITQEETSDMILIATFQKQ